MTESTTKLYDKDSHQRTMTATVLECHEKDGSYQIVLDQTVFFPEGGGQSADTGYFILPDGSRNLIQDVQEKDNIIYHKSNNPIPVDTIVTGTIHWEPRFLAMQHHSGEHLFSGLMHQHFGCDNIGFHMGKDTVTMDFNYDGNMKEIAQIEYLANEGIYKNINIISSYPSKSELIQMEYRSKLELTENVRIVTIPGYDTCACCAPHVKKTGEIGIIKILSVQKYKKGIRVSMICGKQAFHHYTALFNQTSEISIQLSVQPELLSNGVFRLKEDNYQLRGELMELQSQLLSIKAETAHIESGNICIFESNLSPQALREFCNLLMKRCDGICAVFSGSDQKGYHYVLGSSIIDMRGISKEMNSAFQGHGGGSKEMVQGMVNNSMANLNNYIKSIHLADK